MRITDIGSFFLFMVYCILCNNFIFSRFLGCCRFLGVSSKVQTATGMGLAVTFVMGIASLVTYFVNLVLAALGLEYLQTIAFILVIAALVQFVEMFMKKSMPSLYDALGLFIPLIVVNCIILARAEAFASKNGPLISAMDGLGMGLGFTCSITLIGIIRELIGNGTVFGISLLGASYQPMLLLVLAPGGFITYGLVLGIINAITARRQAGKEE